MKKQLKNFFNNCIEWVKENPLRTAEYVITGVSLGITVVEVYKNTKLEMTNLGLEEENEELKRENSELKGSVKTLEKQNHKLIRESNEKDYHTGKLAGEIERINNNDNYRTRKR